MNPFALVSFIVGLIYLITKLLTQKRFGPSYTPISIRATRVETALAAAVDASQQTDVEFTLGETFQLQVRLDRVVPPNQTYLVEVTPKVVADITGGPNLNKLDLKPLNNPDNAVALTMNPSGPLEFTAADQAPKTIEVTVTSIESDVHLAFAAVRTNGPGRKRAGVTIVLILQ